MVWQRRGLAQALAPGRPPVVTDTPTPHLVIVGPIAAAGPQVATVRGAQERAGSPASTRTGRAESAAAIAGTLAEHGCCVAIPSIGGEVSVDEAAAVIAHSWLDLQSSCRSRRILTVVGGQTFAALCHGLGTLQLLVDGEKTPAYRPLSCRTARGADCVVFRNRVALVPPIGSSIICAPDAPRRPRVSRFARTAAAGSDARLPTSARRRSTR